MKKLLLTVCACFSLGCAAQSLTDSLIVYYPFNGNALDCSGHDYHGLTNAEFRLAHNGEPYSALYFNGFDQYLEFPVNRPALKPELPVSFAFRVMFEDLYVTRTYIFDTDYDQNNHSGFWANLTPEHHLSISYGDAQDNTGPGNRRTAIGTSPIDLNTWYFVVIVVNGPNDMQIWINCTLEELWYEGSGEGLGYTDCQGNLGRIDGSVGVTPYYFHGALDDFRFWSRALTTEDINELCMQVMLEDNFAKDGEGILTYPNPAKDFIILSNTPDNIRFVEITDMAGHKVQQTGFSSAIDISNLSAGNYVARMYDTDNTFVAVFKFVKY